MSGFIDTWIVSVNEIGRGFCNHAAGMFVQSSLLIVVLLLIDLALRQRIRATVRYWIWMLVFVKLLLPPTLALPTGIGYWLGGCVTRPVPISPVLQAGEAHAPVMASTQPEVAGPTGVPAVQTAAAEVPSLAATSAQSSTVRTERLTWQGGVFLLWSIGVLVFTGWVLQRLCLVRRLIARAEPAEGCCLDLLDQCRRRVGVRRQIAMRVLERSFSPAVCGLWRPTILMPASLLTRLSPANVRAVLIHELAHVKRADLWVNGLQTALQIIYFYNPLIWLANAMVRRVREQAVDEMALVALGAEAGSYGHTLIDIAEMTFLRANLVLRLVGVVESKKSLEGRIRHMVTRSIPKSARVSITGVLAIIALGAAVLPMAAARTQMPKSKFEVGLSNGATVELVGVCHWMPQGPDCWKADGSPLDLGLHPARWSSTPSPNDYGFMVQVAGPDAPELSWGSVEGANGRHSESDVVDRQDKPVPGGRALIVSLPGAGAETTVRLAVAAGPWTTRANHNGHGMLADGGPEEGILWSPALQDAEGIHIMASTPWRRDRATRIVAVDQEGVVHTASRSSSVAAGNVGQMMDAAFQGLQRDDIQKFEFQVRPYEAVAFAGVSLVPGRKSTVTTTAGPLKEEALGVGGAVSGLDPGTARREYSRTLLTNLGKAVLLYAHDHAGKLPNGIEDVREHFNGVEVERLLEKVVYLGQGLSATGTPARVIAYDKTLLAEGRGTNVLYLDFRVTFEDPSRLKQLGIGFQDVAASVAEPRTTRGDAFRVYAVNRRVADFSSAEDLSTPEAAYATINRIPRDDLSALQKVSIAPLAERLAQESHQRQAPADPEWARVLLNARIRDVIVWKDMQAAVVAELPQGLSSKEVVASVDVRYFQREDGRWLNAGNNRFVTVEQAEFDFMARFNGPEPKAAEEQKVERVAAMERLKQVALAAILYAEDHQGGFASDLAELKPYLRESTRFPVVMENVVYLGKGAKRNEVASPPTKPLAYWMAPMADTVVIAFFDGHVEAMNPNRLKELGIEPKP